METRGTHTRENGRESWRASLVAILPLVAFACACAMDGTMRRLSNVSPWGFLVVPLWANALQIAAIPIVFYFLSLAGLLAAWLEGFPRWSYVYLGWLLVFLVGSFGGGSQNTSYPWRVWGPLLITLTAAIVLHPSLEPLRSLGRGWKQDWTLSVLGVLGTLQFLNGFDEMPGPGWARSVWLGACTAVLVLGVLAYMHLSGRTHRAAALLCSAVLSVALGVAVRAYYWRGLVDSPVLWGAWFALLALPALLAAALNHLWPGRPAEQPIDTGGRTVKKPLYLLAALVWVLVIWYVTLWLLGAGGLSHILVLADFLLLPFLVLTATRAHDAVWMCVAVLILVALSLPAPLLARIFAPHNPLPLDSMAFKLYFILALAFIVAALLLHAGLILLRKRRDAGAEGSEGSSQHRRAGWAAAAALALSALLLAKTLHSFYWFMAWDTTGDGLMFFWLVLPILAVLCSSGVLAIVLPGRNKWAGPLYLLLIPALIGVYSLAGRVDYFALTEARAQRIGRALDTYYARQGRYPQDLRQLTPWTILSLPEPFIIIGQEWCYSAGDTYYRLGAVYHEHWSSPNFGAQLYSTKGDVPELPPLCDQELTALEEYDRFFRIVR